MIQVYQTRLVIFARLAEIKRILGKCLLIPSLSGKASRMLVESRGEAEPDKIYQKMKTWCSIYQFIHWFTLQTGYYDLIIDFYVDSTSWTSFKSAKSCCTDKITAVR